MAKTEKTKKKPDTKVKKVLNIRDLEEVAGGLAPSRLYKITGGGETMEFTYGK